VAKKKTIQKPPKRYLLRKLLDSNDVASSKRFITLIISAHFIIASFVILFKFNNIANDALLEKVLEYDFWIILAGLGFITSENLTSALIENARAKAAIAANALSSMNPYTGEVNPFKKSPEELDGGNEEGENLPK